MVCTKAVVFNYNVYLINTLFDAKTVFLGLAGASSLMLIFPIDCCQTKIIADVGSGTLLLLLYGIK